MDLHRLRVFQAAGRSLSFTSAGRELSLSQSTVSLHIKQLEEELGCPLFIRSSRQVALSEAGAVLLTYADRIFSEIGHAELAVREFATTQRGTIRLGVGATTLTYLLPKVLQSYRKKYPQIEIVVTTAVTEVLLQRLMENQLDLAVVMSPSEALLSVETMPLVEEELVIVLPEGHALSAKPVLTMRDLDGLAFLSHVRGTAMHTVQQTLFDTMGVQPHIAMELENMESMKALVAAGVGAALLPRCCVAEGYDAGLAVRSVRGISMTRSLLLASTDWRAHPPATRRLARRIVRALNPHDRSELPAATSIEETDDGN